MKLRSIASVQVTEDKRRIMANKYTTVLTIPEFFRDWKVFNDPNYVIFTIKLISSKKDPR